MPSTEPSKPERHASDESDSPAAEPIAAESAITEAPVAAETVPRLPPQPNKPEPPSTPDGTPIPQQAFGPPDSPADPLVSQAEEPSPRRGRRRLIAGGTALGALIAGGIAAGVAVSHGRPAVLARAIASPSPYRELNDICRAVTTTELAAIGVPSHVAPIVTKSGPREGLSQDNCSWRVGGPTTTSLAVFVNLLKGRSSIAQAKSIEQADMRSYEQERDFMHAITYPVPGLGDRAMLLIDHTASQPPSADAFLFIQSKNVVIQVLIQRQVPDDTASTLPTSTELRGWDTEIGRRVLNAIAAA
jgi:hypothetical protein